MHRLWIRACRVLRASQGDSRVSARCGMQAARLSVPTGKDSSGHTRLEKRILRKSSSFFGRSLQQGPCQQVGLDVLCSARFESVQHARSGSKNLSRCLHKREKVFSETVPFHLVVLLKCEVLVARPPPTMGVRLSRSAAFSPWRSVHVRAAEAAPRVSCIRQKSW